MDKHSKNQNCPCGVILKANDTKIHCSKCKRIWHKVCLKINPDAEFNDFECPICILYNQDPQNKIVQTIIQPNFLAATAKYSVTISNPSNPAKVIKDNNILELRMLKLVRFYRTIKNRMVEISLKLHILTLGSCL